MAKAKDLKPGDCFNIEVHCEVLSVNTDDGKTTIKIVFLDTTTLEFTEHFDGVELTCKQGREFSRQLTEEEMKKQMEEMELLCRQRAEEEEAPTNEGE